MLGFYILCIVNISYHEPITRQITFQKLSLLNYRVKKDLKCYKKWY